MLIMSIQPKRSCFVFFHVLANMHLIPKLGLHRQNYVDTFFLNIIFLLVSKLDVFIYTHSLQDPKNPAVQCSVNLNGISGTFTFLYILRWKGGAGSMLL